MKRSPLTHARVFNEEGSALGYAARRQKMAQKFGQEYSRKLAARGFQKGRILDVGCGFGGTCLVLAEKFPHSQVVGIDLS